MEKCQDPRYFVFLGDLRGKKILIFLMLNT